LFYWKTIIKFYTFKILKFKKVNKPLHYLKINKKVEFNGGIMMKIFFNYFIVVLFFAMALLNVSSIEANLVQPCPVEADIILNGDKYFDISGEWDGTNYGWVIDVDKIMTAWSEDSCGTDLWVDYEANLTQGTWKIGVCAVNWLPSTDDDGLKSEEWYPYFELSNSLNSDIIYVPASNTEINSGYFNYEVPTNGNYTVRLRWLNDKTEGQKPDGRPIYDANITIVKVFFDKVNEEPLFLDINPDTLNLKSRGSYITAYIELPEGYDVSNIDMSTVKLNIEGSEIYAEDLPFSIGDYNINGVQDIMVKFDRGLVQNACNVTGPIESSLNCKAYDGTLFVGSDVFLVIDKGKDHFSEDQDSVVY
jgi:hypothetical protein